MALSLNWAVVFRSAVACGDWVGVLVQQSFVVSVNDGLDVRATTIRMFFNSFSFVATLLTVFEL